MTLAVQFWVWGFSVPQFPSILPLIQPVPVSMVTLPHPTSLGGPVAPQTEALRTFS